MWRRSPVISADLKRLTPTLVFFAIVFFSIVCWFGSPVFATDGTMSLNIEGKTYTGNPLAWDEKKLLLLGRDGQLFRLPIQQAKSYRQTSTHFQSFTHQEIRARLRDEFGPNYDVSSTQHYIVVHPQGHRNLWTNRFEELYRSFVHYFSARSFQIPSPKFPLVAIVLRTRGEFANYSQSTGDIVGPNVLGYYSPTTNRVVLFDQTGDGSSWNHTAETIIHEAAHQSAFNASIHNRYASNPNWIVEGLGTMFEAPGVWDARKHPKIEQRVNRYRFKRFIDYAQQSKSTGLVADVVASDQLFKRSPDQAYAVAWALSFYLAETRTRNYIDYMKTVAKRKAFTSYSSQERYRDFCRYFGRDTKMLEVQLQRYMFDLAKKHPNLSH